MDTANVDQQDPKTSRTKKPAKTTPWQHHRGEGGGVVAYSHDRLVRGRLLQIVHGETETRGCQLCQARRAAGQPFVVHTPRGLEASTGRAATWYAP